MKVARVPAGPILSTAEIVAEEQYQQRGMFHTACPPSGVQRRSNASYSTRNGVIVLLCTSLELDQAHQRQFTEPPHRSPAHKRMSVPVSLWGIAAVCIDTAIGFFVAFIRLSLTYWPSLLAPGGDEVTMPAMVPVLSATPGSTRWAGPDLGEHTEEARLALRSQHLFFMLAVLLISSHTDIVIQSLGSEPCASKPCASAGAARRAGHGRG